MIKSILLSLMLLLSPILGYTQTLGLSPSGGETEPSGFAATGADFDGTNDYMLRGGVLTGEVDDNQGIMSFWWRGDGGDGSAIFWFSTPGERVRFHKSSLDLVGVVFENTGGTLIAQEFAGDDVKVDTGWHHYILAWDMAVPSCVAYLDDVADAGFNQCDTNGTHDQTDTDWGIAIRIVGGNTLPWNGCMAELYYTQAETIDLTVESNRRKWIDASGKPVDLGSDGSTPTGNQPIIYLNGDETNFQTNAGSGGNFNVTGSLDACSTSASD